MASKYGRIFLIADPYGINLFAQFRQLSQFFGRPLLAMLLFVWLTMALATCVMANSATYSELKQSKTDSDLALSVLHEKMQNCDYCPDKNNAMSTVVLCQNTHDNISDTMNSMVDSIDVESFVLFEIPANLLLHPLVTNITPADFYPLPGNNILSPLELTGILRI